MSLIHDHHIPFARQNRRAVRLAAWRYAAKRSPRSWLVHAPAPRSRNAGSSCATSSIPNFRRISPCHCVISEGGVNTSFPEPHGLARHEQFGQNQAGLNGFAEADLVAKQGSAAQPSQHGHRRACLMLQQFHVAHHGQSDEPIEAGVACQSGGAQPQVEIEWCHLKRGTAQQIEV